MFTVSFTIQVGLLTSRIYCTPPSILAFQHVHSHKCLPTSTITVKFVMPTSGQAAQVLADMKSLPIDLAGYYNRPAPGYQNYLALHYPVYLPLLLSRYAQTDSGRAYENDVTAIGTIATPEATSELIGLMADRDPARACYAAKLLCDRIVDPEDVRIARLYNNRYSGSAIRVVSLGDLQERSWRPEFAGPASENAARLLETDSPSAVAAAASG